MRSGFAFPWPVPSSSPEPLDLKWLTTTANASASASPTALKPWASGWRALENAVLSVSTSEPPTGATSAGW